MLEKPPARSNLTLRLFTAAVISPALIWALFWGPHWVFPAMAAFVCALGADELFAMVAPGDKITRIYGVLASLWVFALIGGVLPDRVSTGALLGLVLSAMLVNLARAKPLETAALRMGWSIAGPLYLGGLFGAIAHLFQQRYGGQWVLLGRLTSFWSDTGGYSAGRAFGKHALSPLVSPKKTIEGSIGGLLAALLGGLLAHFWFLPSLPLAHAVILSLLAAAAGQVGDLCESLIKRSTGVKDSGTILPGHGGMLDRADALLFSSATIWAYVQLFGR